MKQLHPLRYDCVCGGIGGEIQIFMMAGVVVAKYQTLRRIDVTVREHQPVDDDFYIYEFTEMKDRSLDKINLAASKPFMRASFIIGGAKGMSCRTGYALCSTFYSAFLSTTASAARACLVWNNSFTVA